MNYLDGLLSVFSGSLSGVWSIFASFLPAFLLALVSFIVGVLLASLVSSAIAQVIRATKIDKLLERAGVEVFLNKMGLKLDTGKFFGVIIKWFIVIVFLMAALQIMGLTEVSGFIGELVIMYLPKVIVIIIILMVAAIIADAFKKIVVASVRAANISASQMLGSIAKYSVWIIAIILILSQFDEIRNYVLVIFTGIVAFVVIAGGIAFGLGGKDAASRAIEKISKEINPKE